MSTMYDEDLIAETESVVEVESDECCDLNNCDRPGYWLAVMKCCGNKLVICQECMDGFLEDMHMGVQFFCALCKTRDIVSPFLIVEKLKK